MGVHRCPYCGRLIAPQVATCPYCQEHLPRVRAPLRYPSEASRAQIRRGLLYMLLAGVLYYFAAGRSGLELPVTVAPWLTQWALPLLFLGGVGLTLYGIYSRLAN